MKNALPSRLLVRTILRVEPMNDGLGGLRFVEDAVAAPYVKDYDSDGHDRPSCWASRFDLTKFGFFLAKRDRRVVGGAAVSLDASLSPMRM